jgi:hypothetical protein
MGYRQQWYITKSRPWNDETNVKNFNTSAIFSYWQNRCIGYVFTTKHKVYEAQDIRSLDSTIRESSVILEQPTSKSRKSGCALAKAAIKSTSREHPALSSWGSHWRIVEVLPLRRCLEMAYQIAVVVTLWQLPRDPYPNYYHSSMPLKLSAPGSIQTDIQSLHLRQKCLICLMLSDGDSSLQVHWFQHYDEILTASNEGQAIANASIDASVSFIPQLNFITFNWGHAGVRT